MTSALERAKTWIAGLAWLAAFSILFTLGDEIGAWPTVATAAFRNVDLAAGMAAGAWLLAFLLLPPRRETAEARPPSLG